MQRGGKLEYLQAEKGDYEPFGCEFETYLIDKKHSCANHWTFCFIDQMPKGLRETLYFKDDDERLSFLFGNYITLTNLSEREIERIIKMHISPINISVHTIDPDAAGADDGQQERGQGAGAPSTAWPRRASR